jgi:hypothetical protein
MIVRTPTATRWSLLPPRWSLLLTLCARRRWLLSRRCCSLSPSSSSRMLVRADEDRGPQSERVTGVRVSENTNASASMDFSSFKQALILVLVSSISAISSTVMRWVNLLLSSSSVCSWTGGFFLSDPNSLPNNEPVVSNGTSAFSSCNRVSRHLVGSVIHYTTTMFYTRRLEFHTNM